MKDSIPMHFQPIELNGLTTFICQAEVSNESIEQALETFRVLTPHEGKTGTGVNKEKKDSLDITIVPNHCLQIQREIEKMKDVYFHYYSLEEYMPKLAMTEHFNIQKYPLQGAYHRIHADRGYGSIDRLRELVWMTYLNDVHTGGETEFMFYKLKVKPRKGLTIIWPAGWTHLHRGLPSPTTEKIIATGWFSPL
jgi:hypothetical protein